LFKKKKLSRINSRLEKNFRKDLVLMKKKLGGLNGKVSAKKVNVEIHLYVLYAECRKFRD
jgi:hypothetical protein